MGNVEELAVKQGKLTAPVARTEQLVEGVKQIGAGSDFKLEFLFFFSMGRDLLEVTSKGTAGMVLVALFLDFLLFLSGFSFSRLLFSDFRSLILDFNLLTVSSRFSHF